MVSFDRIEKMIAAVPPALALRAALELEIFTTIGDGGVTAHSLGGTLAIDPDHLSRLLYALASVGLLDVEDGLFRNGPEASTFLDASKPTYRGGDHALLRELWSADLLTAASPAGEPAGGPAWFFGGRDRIQSQDRARCAGFRTKSGARN